MNIVGKNKTTKQFIIKENHTMKLRERVFSHSSSLLVPGTVF